MSGLSPKNERAAAGGEPKATTAAAIIRKLGSSEKWQSVQHHFGFYLGTYVSCCYTVPPDLLMLGGTPQPEPKPDPEDEADDDEGRDRDRAVEDLLERAVAQVVVDHPMLRVGLRGESDRQPVWVGIESVDMRRHIEWRTVGPGEDYDAVRAEIARKLVDTKFGELETTPGWRVVALWRRREPQQQHDEEKPFVVVEVLFAWNHANIDGVGGKIFHDELLRNLNFNNGGGCSRSEKTVAKGKGRRQQPPLRGLVELEDHVLKVPPFPETLPPAQEDYLKWPVSAGFILQVIWRDLRPAMCIPKREREMYAPWAPIRPSPFSTRLRTFVLDGPTVVQNVLRRCRQHGTTLTGLLNAVTLLSLAIQLPREEAVALRGETTIDSRRFPVRRGAQKRFPWMADTELSRTMAGYVVVLEHEFGAQTLAKIRAAAGSTGGGDGDGDGDGGGAKKPATAAGGERDRDQLPPPNTPALAGGPLETALWDAAAQVRREIQTRLDAGLRNDMIGLAKLVYDWRDYIKQLAKKPRKLAWVVSNLGVIDGEGDGDGGQGQDRGSQGQGGQGESDGGTDSSTDSTANTSTTTAAPGGGRWQVEHAEFMLSADAAVCAINISAVSVRGKDLSIGVSWQDGVINTDVMEVLVRHTESWLRELGRER